MEKLDYLSGRRCFCSWSGGKDSCLSLYMAQESGASVERLLNMQSHEGERSRSHGLDISVVEAQARSVGIDLVSVPASWDEYEDRFISTIGGFHDEGIETGVFGDIDLEDHLKWEDMVCDKAGMTACLPLWKMDRLDVVRTFLDYGFTALIVSLDSRKLSQDFLGMVLSKDLMKTFSSLGVDPCGENGEYHTVVVDGPNFSSPLDLVHGDKTLKSGYWFLDLQVRS